jgi:hypothetical protein
MHKMTTNRQIAQEIKSRTGLTGVKISKAQGMCRFYSDDDLAVDLSLTDGEYVPRISIYSASEWADIFEIVLAYSGQWDKIRRRVI